MRRLLSVFASAALVLGAQEKSPATTPPDLPDGLYAEFSTPHGILVAELHHDKAPMTVASFVGRAEGTLAPQDGRPFFSGLRWYRVVPDFVLQSGDPVRSTATDPQGRLTPEEGAAGHPLPFPDEFAAGLHHASAGILSMANSGPDTNSSEFFITLRDTHRLNYLHSVFGRVVRGEDLLPLVQQNEPFTIRILRRGERAVAFDASAAAFEAHVESAPRYSGPTEPGPTAHFDDPDSLLPQDVPRARNFNFKLANFERATGRKIYGRVFKEFRPTRTGQTLPAYHRELAHELGLGDEHVLVSYFADLDTWMLWLGEPLLPAFMGRAGSREQFLARDGLMRRKDEFFAAARARGNAFADQVAATGRPVSDAQRLKLIVDEVIDALILLLEPKP